MCDKCKTQTTDFCMHCGTRLTRQELLWIPIGRPFYPDNDANLKVDPIPYKGEKPKRIWTLYNELYSNKEPELPFTPIHLQNAFLEDYIHDWDLRDGFLYYYSRASQGGTWALLEF